MQIDQFKQRTLTWLATRGEAHNTYPIDQSDLLTVGRCALCGSIDVTLVTEAYLESGLKFFTTSTCNQCLYTFRPTSPGLDWFRKCWMQISTKRLEVFNPDTEAIRKRRYEKYYHILAKHIPRGLLVDIGSSYGTGAQVFRERGFDVEAVEPEDDRTNYLENYLDIPVVSSSIEEFVLQKRCYDLIIFAHCLEHLDDPVYVMSHIKDLLEPGTGILYVEVPIIWNSVTWSDALYLTHKSNFSEENLTNLLARNGFEVLERVWMRDNEDDGWDLGLVLKPASGAVQVQGEPSGTAGHTVDDVRRLYREGLTLSRVSDLDSVLRYQVPCIEQFYCTLRFDCRQLLEPDSEGGYITFEPIEPRWRSS